MLRPLFIALLFLTTFSLLGQEQYPVCGTVGEMQEEIIPFLKSNISRVNEGLVHFRETTWVPVKFHLVARNDGSGRVVERDLLDQLCILNEDFADIDVQFYIKDGFSYIDNTTVYDNHINTQNTIMTINRKADAMNVYIVDDATPNSDGIGTTLGYFTPNRDWIVMRRDQVGKSEITLTHEAGHYFSLVHPHRGWDSEPWNKNIHGCPTPTVSPGGVPTELVNGSNCDNAGDLICDTPPDYNGFGWPSCDYDGGACDPSGEIIDPDEKNFMGYFLDCPRLDYYFSDQQKAIIQGSASSRRNLVNIPPANSSIVSGTSELITPIDGVSAGSTNIDLAWSAVSGASNYLVEISPLPNFPTNNIEVFVTNSNSLTISSLQPERLFYWRVKAFNEYSTCEGFSSFETFRTSIATSTTDISAVSSWSISPNPVQNQVVNFELSSKGQFEGQLRLMDVNGKTVRNFGQQQFSMGENNLTLTLDNLSAGLYFVHIQSNEGILTDRLIVTN